MKIVIANDSPTAHFFIRKALGNALSTIKHEVYMWDIKSKSVYDMFDEKEPDMVFIQGYNMTEGYIECIKEYNPFVVVRVSDWSPFRDTCSEPLLKAEKKEIDLVEKLHSVATKVYCHIHHHPKWIQQTHENWFKEGFEINSMMNFADIFDYSNGVFDQRFSSDLAIISGYWGYKSENIHKYIFPLLSDNKYNIKIFGNQAWPVHQYCGFIPNGIEKHILRSTKICLSIHEPHSTKYGYDIVTRPFNLLMNKCLCVSDYVEGCEDLFPDSIFHCKNPKEYKDIIDLILYGSVDNDYSINRRIEQGYRDVTEFHTAYERIYNIYRYFNLDTTPVVEAKERIFKCLQL